MEIDDKMYIKCKGCKKKTIVETNIKTNSWAQQSVWVQEITRKTGFREHPDENIEENSMNRYWYCSEECIVVAELAK